MQPLEIDSAVFCDGAHDHLPRNSSILTCPVTSGAGGSNTQQGRGSEIDREIGGLTGHAACIAVDVPNLVPHRRRPARRGGRRALADLLDETPTRFELRTARGSLPPSRPTPGIPVFPGGIAPAANSYTLAGCCRAFVRRAVEIIRSCTPQRSWPPRRRSRRPGGSAERSRKRSAPPRDCSPATIGIGGISSRDRRQLRRRARS